MATLGRLIMEVATEMHTRVVCDRLAESKGRRVGFLGWLAHAASLVWIEGGIDVLGRYTASGGSLFGIELACLDGEVFTRDWEPLRDLSEDDTFILNHCCV
jgi:hypothetical protein